MNEIFGGDLLFKHTADGLEPVIQDGLFLSDKGFDMAVRLSLFGGNSDDSGGVKSCREWWGNVAAKDEPVRSRLGFMSSDGGALTVAKAKLAVEAAKQDLEWMKKDGICDDIQITATIASMKRLDLEIRIITDGKEIAKNKYSVNWEAISA